MHRARNARIRVTISLIGFLAGGIAHADTRTFVCSYPKAADPEKGLQNVKAFALTFIVDNESGKAYMVGNNGSSKIGMVNNTEDSSLTFLEVTTIGNVMTTTINADGSSVHSRHTVMFGDLIPSQYYGKCGLK
jgi:hypothetical protein